MWNCIYFFGLVQCRSTTAHTVRTPLVLPSGCVSDGTTFPHAHLLISPSYVLKKPYLFARQPIYRDDSFHVRDRDYSTSRPDRRLAENIDFIVYFKHRHT